MSLHPLDIAVVVVYLAGVTILGAWSGRLVKTMGDFFMPRRFGKAMMITHAFGAGTASDQAVLVAAETFRSGLSGIWWQWLWLPVTPFYWVIAPIMRRLRAVTTADAYELRFDRSVSLLFAVVGVVGLSVKIGLMLKGASALIESTSGDVIDADVAVAVVTLLFVVYGVSGGLGAAIVADFFQGILTVVFSFILLPYVLGDVGGLAGVRATLDDSNLLELVAPGKIGGFFIAMYALQALIGIVAQPFIMGVCSAGRTELDGRVGFMFGNILKRICTIAWSLTALAGIAWYVKNGESLAALRERMTPDHLYGHIARAFLPSLAPGMLGLFIASLLAAVMNSCDSYMISSSALFTKNIYRPLAPGRADSHYVRVGRLASLIVVAGGYLFAQIVPDVKTALDIWFRVAPPLGVAFWLGLFWRKTTAAGAWAGTIAGFCGWGLTAWPAVPNWLAGQPWAQSLGLLWSEPGKAPQIYEPWVNVIYLGGAAAACVVVSLLTSQPPAEKLRRFYDLTRTPVEEGEVVAEPCTLPVGRKPAKRPMLVTAWGLEIPQPSRTSVVGFAAGWVCVALLVVGFNWLVG